jgi:hypothetical protein
MRKAFKKQRPRHPWRHLFQVQPAAVTAPTLPVLLRDPAFAEEFERFVTAYIRRP